MASNINPSLTPVNSLTNFKFWCQKVLPLVYDDSLSYYEVLGKMVVQLNGVIDNVNADTENVLTLKDAFLELQTYVNNFFDDIDQLASYAERAEAAQTAANTSAVNAATSASNASASSLAAMDARDTAVTAKQAAETSANTASTAATNANTKANEAAQSAITAQTAQASASQSATLAATDRSAAQTAASTATTKANEASTSASNAETSAENAAQSEANAEGLVNNIQENLDNIQQNTQDISNLKESLNDVTSTTRNLFNISNVQLGIAPSDNPSTGGKVSRLKPDIPISNKGMSVTSFAVPPTITYRVFVYDDEGGYTNNVKKWIDLAEQSAPKTSIIPSEYAGDFVGIRFTSANDTQMTWTDFDGLLMQIEVGTQPTAYIPPETAVDYIAREAANTQTKLKVCSYNIGHFANGVGVVPEDEQGAITAMKAFLNEHNFDLIGLQENLTTFPSAITSNSAIYNSLFPNFVDINNGVSCKSKYALIKKGESTFTTGSPYVYADAIINGKTVFVMSVHLSTTSKAIRITEYNELFNILDQHERYIVFGDFNAGVASEDGEQSEFDVLIAHGCHVANGGYMGLIYTTGDATSSTRRCLDNIVTSPNIIIGKMTALDVFADMYSDHIPLMAELFIS